MSSDYLDYIEDKGAKLYAAQEVRGVQYDQVATYGKNPHQRTKADISAARAGSQLKYDMAAELKASGKTKRIELLCDYLFSAAIKLAIEEGGDLTDKAKGKENGKLLRNYTCLAIAEIANPQNFKSEASRARYLNIHFKNFIRNHRVNYSKVYQVLDDWALAQFKLMVRVVG